MIVLYDMSSELSEITVAPHSPQCDMLPCKDLILNTKMLELENYTENTEVTSMIRRLILHKKY